MREKDEILRDAREETLAKLIIEVVIVSIVLRLGCCLASSPLVSQDQNSGFIYK